MNELKIFMYCLKRKVYELIYVQSFSIEKKMRIELTYEKNN